MKKAPYKYAILVGDGMADRPLEELQGKTILESAHTPHMDYITTIGRTGLVATIPEGLQAGSDVGNLSLFGFDPRRYYRGGRAPLEAASMGVSLDKNHVAFRCNLVTIQEESMRDYSAGHLDDRESTALIELLQPLMNQQGCQLYHGVDYRHLYVMADTNIDDLLTTPPHDITNQPIARYLPQGTGAQRLEALRLAARALLATSAVNQARRSAGKPLVTDIWLWGQGAGLQLPTLQERYALEGSVISAVNLVKGLGSLAGLQVVDVPGATGYLGTNYAGKVSAAAEALQRQDFVYVHLEAPDETGHEGSVSKKKQAIEEFDREVVGPMLELRTQFPTLRILVTADHSTPVSTRTHGSEAVPFAVCGPSITAGQGRGYSERAAQPSAPVTGEVLFNELMIGTFNDCAL